MDSIMNFVSVINGMSWNTGYSIRPTYWQWPHSMPSRAYETGKRPSIRLPINWQWHAASLLLSTLQAGDNDCLWHLIPAANVCSVMLTAGIGGRTQTYLLTVTLIVTTKPICSVSGWSLTWMQFQWNLSTGFACRHTAPDTYLLKMMAEVAK